MSASALSVLDTHISQLQAQGSQDAAASLIAVRDQVEAVFEEARRCAAGVGDLSDLRHALATANGETR